MVAVQESTRTTPVHADQVNVAGASTTRRVPGVVRSVQRFLPRGNLLDDEAWRTRHLLLRWLLFLHAPGLLAFGVWRGYGLLTCVYVLLPILACLLMAEVVQRRRLASFFVTAGLVYCSSALVGLSGGAIEAHFHFFIIIGFIALYQDWVPFLWNIVFTVLSHGLGSAWIGTLIFDHPAAQQNPWLWSLIHGVAVLAACIGMVIFWRYSEDELQKTIALRTRIANDEIERRRFTSDLLVNLARRNQSMLQLQLGILNQLEEQERDPDALADLFRLDHLATRIRRNAESLLVLSGEEAPRVWGEPVPLRDVVRAAIAETEDLDRVVFEVDDRIKVLGRLVAGLTHLLAELVENAVRYSPPHTNVTVWCRPDPRSPGAQVVTVEDWGLGMPAADMEAANVLLADPPDVDLSTSHRFGLHVVSRLAKRLNIRVHLTTTADGGVTAVLVLPTEIFVAAAPTFDGPARQDDPQRRNGWQQPVRPLESASASRTSRAAAEPVRAPSVAPAAPPFVPAAPPFAEAPQSYAPAPQPYAQAPQSFQQAPQSFERAPQSFERAPQPALQDSLTSYGPNGWADPTTQERDPRDDGWSGWWDRLSEPSSAVADPSSAPPPPHAPVPPAASAPVPPAASLPPAAPLTHVASTPPHPPAPAPRAVPIAPQAEQPRVIQLPEVTQDPWPGMARRTPQAHLAPELRRSAQAVRLEETSDVPSPMDALSQYQARRRAALESDQLQTHPSPGRRDGDEGGA